MGKLNIYQKIVEIRKAIDFFKKDKKSYNYEYVSGAQILTNIKEKMDELGVVLVPHVNHAEGKYYMHEYTKPAGKIEKKCVDYIVDAPMTYVWVNAEEPTDNIVCAWAIYGQQDEISKAFGSGLTYAERYFILKFFGIPTDEIDPDAKGSPKNNTKPDTKADEKPKTNTKAEADLKRGIDAIDKKVTELRAKKVDDKVISGLIKGVESFGKVNYAQIKDVKVAADVFKALNGYKIEENKVEEKETK